MILPLFRIYLGEQHLIHFDMFRKKHVIVLYVTGRERQYESYCMISVIAWKSKKTP